MKTKFIYLFAFSLILSCNYNYVILQPGHDYVVNGDNIMQFTIAGGCDYSEPAIRCALTSALKKMSKDNSAVIYEIEIADINDTAVSGSFWFYYPSQNWPSKTLPIIFSEQTTNRK
jgi:hypothetical protein